MQSPIAVLQSIIPESLTSSLDTSKSISALNRKLSSEATRICTLASSPLTTRNPFVRQSSSIDADRIKSRDVSQSPRRRSKASSFSCTTSSPTLDHRWRRTSHGSNGSYDGGATHVEWDTSYEATHRYNSRHNSTGSYGVKAFRSRSETTKHGRNSECGRNLMALLGGQKVQKSDRLMSQTSTGSRSSLTSTSSSEASESFERERCYTYPMVGYLRTMDKKASESISRGSSLEDEDSSEESSQDAELAKNRSSTKRPSKGDVEPRRSSVTKILNRLPALKTLAKLSKRCELDNIYLGELFDGPYRNLYMIMNHGKNDQLVEQQIYRRDSESVARAHLSGDACASPLGRLLQLICQDIETVNHTASRVTVPPYGKVHNGRFYTKVMLDNFPEGGDLICRFSRGRMQFFWIRKLSESLDKKRKLKAANICPHYCGELLFPEYVEEKKIELKHISDNELMFIGNLKVDPHVDFM